MRGLHVPFLDKLADIMGYFAYVIFEDVVVFLGGLFIGAIGIILIMSRWYRFGGGLSEKHGEFFSAIKVEDKGENFSRILVRKPENYFEAVDVIISALSLLILGRHHSRRDDKRARIILYIVLAMLFVFFLLALVMIFHFAHPVIKTS